MKNVVKEYSNGKATIVWKPELCTHASFCWRELPEVFEPKKRPWVNVNGASTERIIAQVKRCPSGALTYYMNGEEGKNIEAQKEENCETTATVTYNGPLLIKGNVCVKQEGKDDRQHPEGAAFCRCSKSENQPFCDGSHVNYPFEK